MGKRVVDETSLTAVADAIRAKAGTSGVMEFPNGFTEAIGAIQAGGGGGSITVDDALSDTSENPVQNKVIAAAMAQAAGVLEKLQSGLSQGEQAIQFLATKVLPDVTDTDNGKLLQVVDGAWAAVAITNGNEVAY